MPVGNSITFFEKSSGIWKLTFYFLSLQYVAVVIKNEVHISRKKKIQSLNLYCRDILCSEKQRSQESDVLPSSMYNPIRHIHLNLFTPCNSSHCEFSSFLCAAAGFGLSRRRATCTQTAQGLFSKHDPSTTLIPLTRYLQKIKTREYKYSSYDPSLRGSLKYMLIFLFSLQYMQPYKHNATKHITSQMHGGIFV